MSIVIYKLVIYINDDRDFDAVFIKLIFHIHLLIASCWSVLAGDGLVGMREA